MKKLLIASLLLLAIAANAAGPLDLTLGGSRLAKQHKNWFKRNILLLEKTARLYVERVAGEPDSYYGILIDYAPPLKIGPKYGGAQTERQGFNQVFGYLNHILDSISVYKMIPNDAQGTSYTMRPLKVEGDKILTNDAATPMTLRLSEEVRIDDPLGGAKIFQANEKGEMKEKYGFPPGRGGHILTQYRWIKAIYNLVHLGSTWHKEFMTGPYLAAYKKEDDVVLHLSGEGESISARFVSDPKFDNVDRKKREKIFTNAKSASLRGEFKASQAAEGMYVLTQKGEPQEAGKEATGRIGLFIDIFDARETLGQAVVELVFVNPADPKDFLMYYTGKAQRLEETETESE